MINAGKKFENRWKDCVPDYVLYYRLPDPPQSFNQSNNLRFSWKNPCDNFLFDGSTRTFFALELKSSKSKSFSFEKEKGTYKTANIHYHQIEALTKFAKIDFVKSGFIFNFRYEDKNTERTYFQDIHDFNNMINEISKKSFNEKDLLQHNPILIEQTKILSPLRFAISLKNLKN